MKKKILILTIISIIVITIGSYLYIITTNDSKRFAEEYNLYSEKGQIIENVFEYKNMQEILNILTNETGLIYLGYPESPWCQEYIKYLNEMAKENEVNIIYYKNIQLEKKSNSKDYRELLKLLDKYLPFDELGNKQIYMPTLIAVKDGHIVGYDDETSWNKKGYKTPEEYWKNEDLNSFKEKIQKMIDDSNENICTSECK